MEWCIKVTADEELVSAWDAPDPPVNGVPDFQPLLQEKAELGAPLYLTFEINSAWVPSVLVNNEQVQRRPLLQSNPQVQQPTRQEFMQMHIVCRTQPGAEQCKDSA